MLNFPQTFWQIVILKALHCYLFEYPSKVDVKQNDISYESKRLANKFFHRKHCTLIAFYLQNVTNDLIALIRSTMIFIIEL